MSSILDVDHLIYFVPDLNEGIDEIQKLLGVRAIVGGTHPLWGTHNALLSIGQSTYLEIIAHDPETTIPRADWLFHSCANSPSSLIAWVLRTDSIDDLSIEAASAGLPIGRIQNGSRVTADGSLLTWRLTDPYQVSPPSSTPFLINWAGSAHPSETAPSAGILTSLSFTHPDPEAVRREFNVLGVDFDVKQSQHVSILASILTPNGEVVLS